MDFLETMRWRGMVQDLTPGLEKAMKELLHGNLMNGQKLDQAFQRKIGFSFFDPPILHSRNIIIKGKVLVAGVALLLTKLGKLQAYPF